MSLLEGFPAWSFLDAFLEIHHSVIWVNNITLEAIEMLLMIYFVMVSFELIGTLLQIHCRLILS